MKLNSAPQNDHQLFQRLMMHDDESATLALFQQLYRESEMLRQWLQSEYGRDARLRKKFDSLTLSQGETGVTRFSEIADENAAWREERHRLRAAMPDRIYGGLAWSEVMGLIHRHRAGTLDPGVVCLVRMWRTHGKATPTLRWAGFSLLESVLPSGRRRSLKHLEAALSFAKKYEDRAKRQSTVGYADWWKLHALFYVLRHPRKSYRTRELIAHLSNLRLNVGAKDIRRFCKRIGLCRDERAGRPRRGKPVG